jgi:hypothetical protein
MKVEEKRNMQAVPVKMEVITQNDYVGLRRFHRFWNGMSREKKVYGRRKKTE